MYIYIYIYIYVYVYIYIYMCNIYARVAPIIPGLHGAYNQGEGPLLNVPQTPKILKQGRARQRATIHTPSKLSPPASNTRHASSSPCRLVLGSGVGNRWTIHGPSKLSAPANNPRHASSSPSRLLLGDNRRGVRAIPSHGRHLSLGGSASGGLHKCWGASSISWPERPGCCGVPRGGGATGAGACPSPWPAPVSQSPSNLNQKSIFEILSTFGDKCQHNGSKNDPFSPKRPM